MNFTAAALSFIGLSRRDETPIPEGVIPPARGVQPINVTGALTLETVYRCVSILETAAKQLSFDVWRDDDRLTGDQISRLIVKPAPDLSITDLIAETVASLALTGNAFWLIGRAPDGRAVSLRVLDPSECAPILDKTTGARSVMWRGTENDSTKIKHLRLLRVPSEASGLGPIQACARTLMGARDMASYAANWTQSSGVPSGILASDQELTKDQADEARRRWNESNSHGKGVAVMGKGMKFTPLMLNPAEIQFLESRAFDVLSIGRMFGIPAHMILASLDGNSMTYQNVTDAATDFVRWTLMGYLREIEDALTSILPAKTKARFNLDALLRADTNERIATHKLAIEAGIYSAQEAREIEGLS